MNRRSLLAFAPGAAALGILGLAGCTTNSSGGVTVDLATAQQWAAKLPAAFTAAINAAAAGNVLPAATITQARGYEASLALVVAQFDAIPPGGQGVAVAQQILSFANSVLGDLPEADLPPAAADIVAAIQIGLSVLQAFVGSLFLVSVPAMPAKLTAPQ